MEFGECPACGSRNIRGSYARGVKERLLSIMGWMPFRCRQCEVRFTAFIWDLMRWRFARCPRCLRTKLSTWSETHYIAPQRTLLLLRLGAHPYRCEFCRCNFASFRRRRERFSWSEVRTKSREAGKSSEI
jgi:hypothetical protein